MMRASWSTLAVASLSISLLSTIEFQSQALGQTTAVAEVSGTVSDPTGGAVAGAQVIATETDKHSVHTTTTSALGHYALPNLPVGPYRLEVKAAGFKDSVQTGLEMRVGNNIQINFVMQVGSVNETVEVVGSANLVETKENSVST